MKRRSCTIVAVAATVALAAPTSAIRGGSSNNNVNRNNGGGKRTKHDRRRPPVHDEEGQHAKVRSWHRRQLGELLAASSSHDRNMVQPPQQPQHRQGEQQQRELYTAAHHKKKNSYHAGHVQKAQDALPQQFQQHGPPPAPASSPKSSPGAGSTADAVSAAFGSANSSNNKPAKDEGGMVAHSSSASHAKTQDGQGSDSASANPYYPLFTSSHSVGTCTNNGNEPPQFHEANRQDKFLFDSLDACCDAWYYDAANCKLGFAEPVDGKLLLRNWVSGELLEPEEAEGTGAMVANSSPGNSGSSAAGGFASSSSAGGSSSQQHRHYPSFNLQAHPDGACLSDGNEPGEYSLRPADYLFDDAEACCQEWFMDQAKCLEASTAGDVQAMSSGATEEPSSPSPTPFDGSPWPTWDDADFDEEPAEDAAEDAADADAVDVDLSFIQEPEYLFFESFESGDFDTYDWTLPTYSPEGAPAADKWEADQSQLAYDGAYAARPGVLSAPGMQSNLTISLENMDVSNGGLLSFAVHAAVEAPMDALYFLIHDQIIRTFDKVTGDIGEWVPVSVLLLPGEHTLTWSYQYFGEPSSEWLEEHGPYTMDERRMGNSWIDAIKLEGFTGDTTFSDDGLDALSLLSTSSSFSLRQDGDAFEGAHSYQAATEDIASSMGSIEMAWTIIAGPEGGVVSFAVDASVHTPLDVFEFVVNGAPQVLVTTPTGGWETHYVAVDPGKHVVKWRLVKNFAQLSDEALEEAEVHEDYEGWVKVDGISYVDNAHASSPQAAAKPADTTTAATTTSFASTTEEPEETSTTTEAPGTTTTEAPEEETTTTAFATTTEAPEETTTSFATTTEAPEEPTTTTTSTTEAPVAQSDSAGGCPEGLKSVPGLPGCCLEEPNYLGDGACDPGAPYNTEACAYDLGDCCRETCNTDSPYGCKTKEGEADYGPFGFFCLDPRYGIIDEDECDVENREWIGDGGCDAEGGYNTEACGWDMGDCCEETCDAEFSFYPCGANQPYACEDPDAGNTGTPSTGSAVYTNEYYFHDSFEANVFDPLRWSWLKGNAAWEIERDDASSPASEGSYYAEARTDNILDDGGTSELWLSVESAEGGVLSYSVQALVHAPFEDLVVQVDDGVADIVLDTISNWEVKTVEVPSGRHIVKWILRRNPSRASEEDLALAGGGSDGILRVDDVTFRPNVR